VDIEEGGSVSFRIVAVKPEALILGDLPAQGFAVQRKVGVLTHTARYEPW
jgi:hypothetical protein